MSEYSKKWWRGNRERQLAYHNNYRNKLKKLVYDYYSPKCNCCGESTLLFLSIDHVNNDGHKEKNKDGKRIASYQLYQKIIREGFPDRYQILCSNCNYGKRMNKGVCPHNIGT